MYLSIFARRYHGGKRLEGASELPTGFFSR